MTCRNRAGVAGPGILVLDLCGGSFIRAAIGRPSLLALPYVTRDGRVHAALRRQPKPNRSKPGE